MSDAHRGYGTGFVGMLEQAFGSPEKSPQPLQPPRRESMSGFQRQLEASEYGGSQNTVQSAVQQKANRAFLEDRLKRMETRILKRISKTLLRNPSRSTPSVRRSAEKMITMHDGTWYEIIRNQDRSISFKRLEPDSPKQTPVAPPIPECMIALAYHDRQRMEQEKARKATLAKRTTIRRGYGLKAMLTEAYR